MLRRFGACVLTAHINSDLKMNHSLKKMSLPLAATGFSPHEVQPMFIQHPQKWSQDGKIPLNYVFFLVYPVL